MFMKVCVLYSSQGVQDGSQHQSQIAFVEMWLLSFSDVLVISAYSTFGYVPQGKMVALQVHKLKNLLATYEIGENFLLCQLVGWVFLGMFLPIVLLFVNSPCQSPDEFGKR